MKKTTRTSSAAGSRKAERLVAARRKELAALDDEFFAEVVGVAQAIDALRKALSKLSSALDARQYEKASELGYEAVASEFIFLQRTLGGLQGACLHKEGLVQQLAFALRCPYEDVLPKVDALLAPSGKSTKMARKTETDLSRYDLSRGTRGKYFEKARRSFETIIVDKKVAATLGGAEGVTALLEALAKSLGQTKKKRRAA